MGKAKGTSETTNNSITLAQRAMVFDWCKTHKDDKSSYSALSIAATSDLGFIVSENCLKNHYVAVNGPRRSRETGGTLAAKIIMLETRISEIEKRLDDVGA